MENNELLQAILSELKELRSDMTTVKEDVSILKADVEQIKEDTAITRASVNEILDWADDASVQIIPLFGRKKAE